MAETPTIQCKDCQKDFSLTEGEVYFYTHTISNEGEPMTFPKRCASCRRTRKKNKANVAAV